MYDTLIMLRPEASFTVDELYRIALDVVKTGSGTVVRQGNLVSVSAGGGQIHVGWSDAAHVVEESNEIAEKYGVPSQGCRGRFEMAGDDPDMDLFNEYLIINQRLQKTGKFVIFDTQECKLLFEEPA
jgi:hypothetical protein